MQVQWITDGNSGPASAGSTPIRLTIATLVNDPEQYAQMLDSFCTFGFAAPDVEFIAVDNSAGNRMDAYRAIDAFLDQAQGHFVIICHQDVRLLADDRAVLEARLAELDQLDPSWAVAGNAGAGAQGLVIRISDPHGVNQSVGAFPGRVMSLDENFLVFKSAAKIRPSKALGGFHLYGTDCCLQAMMKGRTSYVIDFHLRHLSAGSVGAAYYRSLEALEDEYFGRLDLGPVQTTCITAMVTKSRLRLQMARTMRAFKKMKKLRAESRKSPV